VAAKVFSKALLPSDTSLIRKRHLRSENFREVYVSLSARASI
jgi:hypothetical protein